MKNRAVTCALLAVILGLVVAQQVLACTATCANGTCSGNKKCYCDAGGNPVCEDWPPVEEALASPEGLAELHAFLEGFDRPGFSELLSAVEGMQAALVVNDLQGYLDALARFDAGLKSLPATEQGLLTSRLSRSRPLSE